MGSVRVDDGKVANAVVSAGGVGLAEQPHRHSMSIIQISFFIGHSWISTGVNS